MSCSDCGVFFYQNILIGKQTKVKFCYRPISDSKEVGLYILLSLEYV